MNVAVGAVAGVAVTPLVYWAATRMLNTAVRIPRTPEAMVVLTAACAAADAAVATLTGPITITAYAVFAFGVLTAAVVDAVERRIPNRITYPLLAVGVLGLPWLTPIFASRIGCASPLRVDLRSVVHQRVWISAVAGSGGRSRCPRSHSPG